MLKRFLVCFVVASLAGLLPAANAQQVRRAEAVGAAPSAAPTGGVGVALRDGDSVNIRIANVPPEDIQQFDGSYTVDEDGMLNLPFNCRVKAGGLPPSQVQTLVQNTLISAGIYTMPTVMVTPTEGARFIFVGGAVRAPGRLSYSSDLTLMTTINAAGGKSDFAGDKIRLIRGGKVQYYSLKRLTKDPSKDPAIEPGDQIEILESWF
jgi:protein involved in polysaccharide export with SLBB domain